MRQHLYNTVAEDLDAPYAAKILVVGHALSGKTTLVNQLCAVGSRGASRRVSSTVGCTIALKALGPATVIFFCDVGGHEAYKPARSTFYEGGDYDGVMLVYDLCNARSWSALPEWAEELADSGICIAGLGHSASSLGSGLDHLEGGGGGSAQLPAVLVGNKADVRHPSAPSALAAADLLPGFKGAAAEVCALGPAAESDAALAPFLQAAVRHRAGRGRQRHLTTGGSRGSWEGVWSAMPHASSGSIYSDTVMHRPTAKHIADDSDDAQPDAGSSSGALPRPKRPSFTHAKKWC
ncbi:hypothetical protein JKP88DRAFT_346389 [Tribonema minus]|uniref:Uncharacterized protein n=1 Tax=Tribonema minus TaxID=303371 RepID=A0A835ZG16_9STRA|nr:hypothetical protein JKP88DRAFT_346389 [Tribonema minus]